MADFDGDGYNDVFLGMFMNSDKIFFGDQDNNFSRSITLTENFKEWSAFSFDADKDGDLDIVLGHQHSEAGRLLVNDGSGGFTSTSPNGITGMQGSVIGADFDKDGDVDLADVYFSKATQNNGDGTFSSYPVEVFLVLVVWFP